MSMKRNVFPVFGALLLLSVMGFGCAKSSSETNTSPSSFISGPQPLSLEGLNSKDAARKITFVSGNVIVMRESFTGYGKTLAETLGLGSFIDRDIIVKRFSPSLLSEVDWKSSTKLATPNAKDASHMTQMQYVGTVLGGNLRDSHSLFPPVYWREGSGTAFGTGVLWLSQEVYENLSKAHVSTLRFGLEDGQLLDFASSTPELRKVVRNLQNEINAVIERKDVFLTTATSSMRELTVNGKKTVVDVLVASNWFGEIVVLDNPTNPLVLNMKIGKPGGIDFGGLFDFEITELKGLQQ